MFDNKKDPMVDVVQKVMDENVRRRQIEADFNEELGIQDRKQLGHEKHDLYDQALAQRINEVVLSPKQKTIATIAGNPKKIDAPDLAKLRGMKNEAKDVKNEEPPFKPDPPRKKRPDEPKTAKGLAKQAMRDMIAKADKAKPKQNMEEEQIDEERKRTSAVSSAFLAGKPAKQKELQTNGQEMTYHGNVIAKHAGDEVHVTTAGYGHSPSTRGHINGVLSRLGAPGLSQKRGKLMHGDTEVGTRDWIKIKKPTATMSEGNYTTPRDKYDKIERDLVGDVKSSKSYDEKLRKEQKLRVYRRKNVEHKKTMSEEQIDELSKKKLGDYIKKASHDVATKSAATGRFGEKSRKHSEDALASSAGRTRPSSDTSWKKTMAAIDTDKMANKFFRKSWKRREGIAKAVDKITNEEQIDELSKNLLGDYIVKASHDAADSAATGALLRGGPVADSAMHRRALRSHGIEAPHIRDLPRDNDANKFFKRSWKRRKGIETAVRRLKRGRPHNVTNEDVSLESVQEEIRNNLLERANSLLEHGSREQIVEFMNNLTMEQRSILNMQEQLAPVRPYVADEPSKVPGVETLTDIGKALNPDNGPANRLTGLKNRAREAAITRDINKATQSTVAQGTELSRTAGERLNKEFGPPPVAPAPVAAPAPVPAPAPVAAPAPPNGGTKQKAAAAAAERDKQGLQASGAPKPQGPPTATQAAGTEKNSLGITKIETDSAQKAREAAAATASGNQPKPGTPEHNDISAQRPGSPEIKQVQQNMKDDPRPGDKENLAATLAKPDISSGDESAGLNMNIPNYGPNKPAAQQQAAPPSVKPRPAPSSVSTADTGGDKYGSGNASAGFERGKYAAPDAADNSSGANELRSKQQAVDRHQVNESKSKYMSESKNFEKFLRKNKYGKIT